MQPACDQKLKSLTLTEAQWDELRRQLVQHVEVSDARHAYRFRCETATELWRARSLLTKEEGTVQWIDQCVQPGDVFYDIGANVGLYTILAGKRVGAAGMVYAFEPHVGNVHSLLFNIGGNGLADRVKVLSSALHEREGYFDFNYCHPDRGTSMSQLGDLRDATGRPFDPVFAELKHATTIDQLLLAGVIRPANHVKIDVDGNELCVLKGMRNLVAGDQAPQSIQIEINTRHKQELFSFMQLAGFRTWHRHDTKVGLQAIRQGQDPESIGYNAVFRRAA